MSENCGDKKRIGKGLVTVILAFVAFYAVGMAYKLIAFPYIQPRLSFWLEWCIRYAVLYGIGLPLFIGISKKEPAVHLEKPGKLDVGKFLKYAVIALGLTTVGGMLQGLILSLMTKTPVAEMPNYFKGGTVLEALLFLCIVPPFLEEMFFRRILLGKLEAYGERVALFGSALAFAVYHTLLTSFQILHVFLLGILLAYVCLRTRRILYSMLIHAIVNLWSVWSGFVVPALPEPFSMFAPALILPVMIGFIVILIKNRKRMIGIITGKIRITESGKAL